MVHETGNISVHTQNIFPVIKKWLYSDKDIFIRELVSNGCDAIQKMKRILSLGEAEIIPDPVYSIKVVLNKEKSTIQVIDDGIGMTADEVRKYINQVAFSGAEEFLTKYQNMPDEANQIIGHFGLGFYSVFMVSDSVQVDTLSYLAGSQAVSWNCTGGTEYSMEDSDRCERGTTVTLHISQDCVEFLDYFRLKEILDKYCYFLPIEIYLHDESKPVQTKDREDVEEDIKPINDTYPLWLKKPSETTAEEYKEFYAKVFNDFQEPLFWIHLNVDYPFNLKGILYFPKLRHEFESTEGRVKLYCNQVFVADNIKEVIPEFLLLLKGIIDCPDLPLNVSRSFLQNDAYVGKISSHITKKVSDKLTEIFNGKRDEYNRYWEDINPFVKYGCLRDDKFYDRVKDIIVYSTISGQHLTLFDFREKNGDRVFYVTDEKQQAQYINLFKENGMDAVIMPTVIDRHFIQFMEFKDKSVKFSRIDSDISDSTKDMEHKSAVDLAWLEDIFKEIIGVQKLEIKLENLKTADLPAIVIVPEHVRRTQEFSMQFGDNKEEKAFAEGQVLMLNGNNELIKALHGLKGRDEKKEDLKAFCEMIYHLAMLGHRQLEPEQMTKFLHNSSKMLARLVQS